MLASQVQAVLATVEPCGRPATYLMAFCASPDLQYVYVATHTAARKATNMNAEPRVSLLWDNRTGNLADHSAGVLVTANGVAARMPAHSNETTEAVESLLSKNPNLAGFLDTPDIGLYEIQMGAFEVVEGYDPPKHWSPTQQGAIESPKQSRT